MNEMIRQNVPLNLSKSWVWCLKKSLKKTTYFEYNNKTLMQIINCPYLSIEIKRLL